MSQLPPEIQANLPASQTELAILAWVDELTGLYNRRFFMRFLPVEIKKAQENKSPLSLFMIDVDKFKLINDNYGHLTGDEVLSNVANLLKQIIADKGIPIRYAGDEFAAILAGLSKSDAFSLARKIIEAAPNFTFAKDADVPVTLSIGLATFPEDAQNHESLMACADEALYLSKKEGRNRVSLYRPEKIPKLPLTCSQLIGRDKEAQRLLEKVQNLIKGEKSLTLISAPPGLGKTRLIKEIANQLSSQPVIVLKAQGDESKSLFPFYIFGEAFQNYLNEVESKPPQIEKVAFSLSYLSLKEKAGIAVEPKDIEAALIFLAKQNPLVFLVDDFHLADLSTIDFIKKVFPSQLPLLFIGTMTPDGTSTNEALGNLVSEKEQFNLEIIQLNPLTPSDVTNFVEAYFPKNTFRPSLVQGLYKASKGNPLLLEEILRLLVDNQKIVYLEEAWRAEEIDPASFTLSLDEALQKRLEHLDQEVKEILAEAAALGVKVDVPLLAKMLQKSESEIWENLDKASREGLLEETASGEHFNFNQKLLQQELYHSLSPERMEETHKKMGETLESLFPEQVQALAPLLFYHFQQAQDEQRANRYRQFLGKAAAPPVEEVPIEEKDMEKVLSLLRSLRAALTNLQLYPPTSHIITETLGLAYDSLQQIFQFTPALTISEAEKRLLINGQKIETKGKSYLEALLDLLIQLNIKSITFNSGLDKEELRGLLNLLNKLSIEKINLEEAIDQARLEHIAVNEKVYVPISEPQATGPLPPESAPIAPPEEIPTPEVTPEWAEFKGLTPTLPPNLPELAPDQILAWLSQAAVDSQLLKELGGAVDRDKLQNMFDLIREEKELPPEVLEKKQDILEKLKEVVRHREALKDLKKKIEKKVPPSVPKKQKEAVPKDLAERFATTLKVLYQKNEGEKAREALMKLVNQLPYAKPAKAQEIKEIIEASLPVFAQEDLSLIKKMGEVLLSQPSSQNLSILSSQLFILLKEGQLEIVQELFQKAKETLPPDKLENLRKSQREVIDSLVADLLSRNEEVKKQAKKVLLNMGEASLDSLISFLARAEKPDVRKPLIEIVKQIVKKSPQLLWEEILQTSSPVVLTTLLEISSELTVAPPPEASQLLLHEDPKVKAKALKALAKSQISLDTDLILALIHDPDVSVAKEAVSSLGQIDPKEAVPILKNLLSFKETPSIIQREAVQALSIQPASQAVPIIEKVFFEKKLLGRPTRPREVRLACLKALQKLGDEKALKIIEKARRDRDEEVKKAAQTLLGKQEPKST